MTGSEKTKPGRRVVCLHADYDTQEALRQWALGLGFDLGWSFSGWPQHSRSFAFHVTLIATSNKVDLEPRGTRVDPLTLEPSGFAGFGDDGATPALVLAPNATLSAIRDFLKSLGCEPTYADFRPHVTLSYRWQGTPALESLHVPPFPLVFDRLVISELVEHEGARSAMAATADASTLAPVGFRDTGAAIAGTRKTKDGYLVADVRCARAGIQEYAGFEVGRNTTPVVRVYRPDSEVFARDAMASYAHRPVTMGHPDDWVTADNWRREAVGNTGGEISRDGGYVRVPLVLMDAGAIADVERGSREISMGYDCTLDWTAGTTPDGQQYDAVQRNLRMNHLAIVERGRAGPECRVGDGARPKQGATDNEANTMKHIVDGITYDMSEQAVELVSKLQSEAKRAVDAATAAAAAVDAANKARDAAIGERDALKSQMPTADTLDKMAAERAAVVDAAKKLCPDMVADGKSLADIRAHVVKAMLGDAAVDGRSTDYVAAAFDTLTLAPGADPVAAAIKGAPSASKAADAAAKARDEYHAWLTGAYKAA